MQQKASALETFQPIIWLTICFAAGIAAYFALEHEPAWPLPMLIASILLLLAFMFRRRYFGMACLFVAMLFAGFSCAAWHTAKLATPQLTRELQAKVTGKVIAIERRQEGVRLALAVQHIAGRDRDYLAQTNWPKQLRIGFRHMPEFLPPLGSTIILPANLMPPSPPVVVGGFDFRRQAFFDGWGAVGFSYGGLRVIADPPAETGWNLWFEQQRQDIENNIYQHLQGSNAAIATALLTGEQSGIDMATIQVWRVSGLQHLLSISGLHIALVAGLIFFILRGGLALWPWAALHWPIKKIAACLALLAITFYTLLVGAPVPTQRALLMMGLVLLAIMLDRQVISLRTVFLAALFILIISPYSLLSVSFQLSFAAVLGMVAGYEFMQQKQVGLITSQYRPWWQAPFYYAAAVAVTSLLASVATMPLIIAHFQQISLYGIFANMVAVPLTSFVVMPMGIISYLLIPLDMAHVPLHIMGMALSGLTTLAEYITTWPKAWLHTAPMPLWSFCLLLMGGLWLCLGWYKRGLGLVLVLAALLSLLLPPAQPLMLVARNGDGIAVQTTPGHYALADKSTKFIEQQMAQALGQADLAEIDRNDLRWRCDSDACLYQYQEGQTNWRILWAKTPAAIYADCAAVNLILVPELDVPQPANCHTPMILLKQHAPLAIYANKNGLEIKQDKQQQRPWSMP